MSLLPAWALLAGLICFGVSPVALARADGPVLRNGEIVLTDVPQCLLEHLAGIDTTSRRGTEFLSVHVAAEPDVAERPLPAVLGSYDGRDDTIVFVSRYAFRAGLSYRVSVNPEALDLEDCQGLSAGSYLVEVPTIDTPDPEVDRIFPSGGQLPENALRIYVIFSEPMQRGWVRENIRLVGPDGDTQTAALLDLDVELWDPAMQRLTVLLNPGRIKRGVGSNLQAGAPLADHDQYALVIGSGMRSAAGEQLEEDEVQGFTIVDAIRSRIDPETWDVRSPEHLTRAPLVIGFDRPMDAGLARRLIRVLQQDGTPLPGTIEVGSGETLWSFTPRENWAEEEHIVEVDAALEDVSGNNLRAPFDVDTHIEAVRGLCQKKNGLSGFA